jgi:hypothetical protein
MKRLVASFSLFNKWATCPHQAYRMYIARDLPKEPETPEMRYGNEVHRAMEKRVRSKTPLPEAMLAFEPLVAPLDACHVEPEQKLGMTKSGRPVSFWDDDVWLRGVLDAPVRLSTDAAVLVDWKTGKKREEPFELEIGALLLQAHRPEITKLVGCYVWLKERQKGQPHDLSDTARTWAMVQSIMGDIEHSIATNRFDKTPGPLCGWCPVLDCAHNRRGR